MLRDITIGQYYPVDSKIHRLDPRVKIIAVLLYLISLISCGSNSAIEGSVFLYYQGIETDSFSASLYSSI